MRVMLGQLPPSAAVREGREGGREIDLRDAYS
jgi:hypothetical protein